MMIRSGVFLTPIVTGIILLVSSPAYTAATLELYGTFHAMGVTVTIATSDDPDGNAATSVTYRISGSGSFHQGFQLSRISQTNFVGSLFWLSPGTTYDVRVTFTDPGGSLNGVTVEATASTRNEITIPTPSHSYYVNPTGTGTTCSQAAPCSINEGLNQAQPGDEVVLRGGVYYQGEFTLPRSGNTGAPIIIRSYPGETAVLDGADPATFTWTNQGGGIYRATVNASDPHVVLANGLRLFPYQSLSDLQTLSWGIPGFYANGTTVYMRLANNGDPNTAVMTVSRFNHAFYVEQNFIYFINLTFRHYGQGGYPKTIYFIDGSDNLIQGCTFTSNDIGVGIKYNSHRNVIQDSEFYDTIFNWPWDGVKAVGGIEDGGVYIYDPMSGRGNVIRRNRFHDDFDGLHVCPWTPGASNETDFYENQVYNMGDDGIETDGECSNVRIWSNTFHDVLMGISLAPVQTGPVYAIRNLIYRTGAGNGYGSSFKFNSGYSQSGPMFLFHNTVDANQANQNGLTIFEPGTWKTIYSRNNIWAGTAYALENYNTSQPIDLDYDDLYTTQTGELAWWDGLSDSHLNTLAEFQTATGLELNGLNVPPNFVDATSGNYTLNSNSSLIDKGVVIPGINDNYLGAAPDIGAFEFQNTPQTETVSQPTTPNGSTNGNPGTSYSYTTGGSTSSLGHSVEYQFDWNGDGSSDLSSWGSSPQSKTWNTNGTYSVRARARCTQDTSVISSWSGTLSVTISGTASIFSDVPTSYWAYNYILAIYNAHITTGCSQNPLKYCPEDNVTREQMAAFIVRAKEGEPAANYCDTGLPFTDVTSTMWSCKYIKRLKELGITTGYGDGRYGPSDMVTREQMAAFIIRAVEGEPAANYCSTGSPFTDVDSNSWACKYIKRLKERGITTGYGDGRYGPSDMVTRAQMAAFLARAFLGMQ